LNIVKIFSFNNRYKLKSSILVTKFEYYFFSNFFIIIDVI
jgi:hypothetical protein